MKILIKSLVILATIFVLQGCLSYNTIQGSKEMVAMRKAVTGGNAVAIRAIKAGDIAQSGIDVGLWEAISERPVLQTGAAIGDALIVWGGYEGVQWIRDDSDDNGGSSGVSTSRDNANVNISGDGNEVNVNIGNTVGAMEEASSN